jgi:hypothetical protein
MENFEEKNISLSLTTAFSPYFLRIASMAALSFLYFSSGSFGNDL